MGVLDVRQYCASHSVTRAFLLAFYFFGLPRCPSKSFVINNAETIKPFEMNSYENRGERVLPGAYRPDTSETLQYGRDRRESTPAEAHFKAGILSRGRFSLIAYSVLYPTEWEVWESMRFDASVARQQ